MVLAVFDPVVVPAGERVGDGERWRDRRAGHTTRSQRAPGRLPSICQQMRSTVWRDCRSEVRGENPLLHLVTSDRPSRNARRSAPLRAEHQPVRRPAVERIRDGRIDTSGDDEQRISRAQRQRRRVVHDGVDERFTHLGLIHDAEIEQRRSWSVRPIGSGATTPSDSTRSFTAVAAACLRSTGDLRAIDDEIHHRQR